MVTVNLNSRSIRAAFKDLCDERDSGNIRPDFVARWARVSLLMDLVSDAEFSTRTGIPIYIDGSGVAVTL